MKQYFLVTVFFLYAVNTFAQSKTTNFDFMLFSKYNMMRKDVIGPARHYLVAHNTLDIGFAVAYRGFINKKKTFLAGAEAGLINTRYSFDLEPNSKELGFVRFYGDNRSKIKTSLLSVRGSFFMGKNIRIRNKLMFTLLAGFLVDFSIEAYKVHNEFASSDINDNLYVNVYSNVALGANSQADVSQFVDVGISNLVPSNPFLAKLKVGVRVSGKLVCHCGGSSNVADAIYYDIDGNSLYNSFDNKKTALLFYFSYPIF